MQRITIGNIAGHSFPGKGIIRVARHCKRGEQAGLFFTLVDITHGLTKVDRWFVWGRWQGTRFVQDGAA